MDWKDLYERYLAKNNTGSPMDYVEAGNIEQDLSIPQSIVPSYSDNEDLLLDQIKDTSELKPEPSIFQQVSNKIQSAERAGNVSPTLAPKAIATQPKAPPISPKTTPVEEPVAPTAPPAEPLNVYPEDLSDEALKQAQNKNRQGLLLKGLMQGAGLVGAGIGHSSVTPEYTKSLDTIEELGKLPLADILERRKGKEQELSREKSLLDLKQKKDENDPNSPISVAGREQFKLLFPNTKITDNTSYAMLDDIRKNLGLKEALLSNQEIARLKREELSQRREEIKAEKEQVRNDREEARVNKQVEALSNKAANSQELFNAIGSIESQLGFNLEEAKITKNGEIVAKGKKRDLPGVSMPGLGRVSFYSGGARTLQDSVARIFNTVLKDRSGAAVTTPEMERLRTEFSAGKFNTEAELIGALQRYKDTLKSTLKNIEAGYTPEAKERYKERGGLISEDIKTKSESTPSKNTFNTNELEAYAKQYNKTPDEARKFLESKGYSFKQ